MDTFGRKNSLGNQKNMTPSFGVKADDENLFFNQPVPIKKKTKESDSSGSGSGFVISEIIKTQTIPGRDDEHMDNDEMLKNSSTVRFGSRYKKPKADRFKSDEGLGADEHSFGQPNSRETRVIENLNPEFQGMIGISPAEGENDLPDNNLFQNLLEKVIESDQLTPMKHKEDYKGIPGMENQYGHLYKDDNLTVISEKQSVVQSHLMSNPMGFSQSKKSSDGKSALMATSPYFESGITITNTPRNHKNRFAYSGNEPNNTHFGNKLSDVMKSDLVVAEKRFSGVQPVNLK